jgi:hypothetical protein
MLYSRNVQSNPNRRHLGGDGDARAEGLRTSD